MKIAISLIWIRHKIAGGVESFTRNLLDGFSKNKSTSEYYLLCSKDNIDTFRHYSNDNRFKIIECPVCTKSLKQTILFETFKLDKVVTSLKADICFVPTYRMPMLWKRNKYVVVIHDLICCHFPESFREFRGWWLKNASKRATQNANLTITISDFVKKDIVMRFGTNESKLKTIYNPILPSLDIEDFEKVKSTYNIEKDDYFYSVSSLAENKNLLTLLKVMKALSDDPVYNKTKLLISGVGMNSSIFAANREKILRYVKDNNLENRCIFTGFVSNEVRNSLIKNSSHFLFASVFEGFGMPVVEALELGARVVTTKCASIPEVSHGNAVYVNDPYSVDEWIQSIKESSCIDKISIHFTEYEPELVISQYLQIFQEVINK